MITLTVANAKGGSGKTTSTAHLAAAFHEQGQRVLVVDADPQRSALTWSELADWPFPCVGMPTARLHRELPGIVGNRFDVVVIDTPPNLEARAIIESAVRASTHTLVPCAPSAIEVERLRVLWPLLEDAAAAVDQPPLVAVLLVRTIAGAASTAAYRDVLTDDGWRVLRSTVARREAIAQSFGDPITNATHTGYGDAIREFIDNGQQEESA
jgi:chromosome partitioning protein